MFPLLVFLSALATTICFVFAFRRASNFGEVWLVVGMLAGVGFICVVASAFHTGDTTGDGDSVGTVVNVAVEGRWWPKPVVHLLHRGEMKADQFAIEDGLLDKARAFAESGERVRVHYRSSMICGAWNYANCDVIEKIDLDPDRQDRAPNVIPTK